MRIDANAPRHKSIIVASSFPYCAALVPVFDSPWYHSAARTGKRKQGASMALYNPVGRQRTKSSLGHGLSMLATTASLQRPLTSWTSSPTCKVIVLPSVTRPDPALQTRRTTISLAPRVQHTGRNPVVTGLILVGAAPMLNSI